MDEIIEEIKQICPHDLYEIGYASLQGLLKSEYSKYEYGLSLARKLDDSIIDDISNGPTILYYNLYHRINDELDRKTKEISDLLQTYNIEAYPIKATLEDNEFDSSYWETLRYSFSHKMVATRSGLGWIGKTDLLVTSRFGPRVRLASILTTSSISDIGNTVNKCQCGSCSVCVDNCPAHAATGESWTIEIDRDRFYNPFKCREFCRKISAEKIKKEISLCGICMSVCPRGKSK